MMDYYIPEPEVQDRPIATMPNVRPSAPAPLTITPNAGYPAQPMQWLTLRNIGFAICGVVVVGGLMLLARTGSPSETVKIAPPSDEKASVKEMDKLILDKSKIEFSTLQSLSNNRMDEDRSAAINERSKEILEYANKQLADKNSDCYRSPNGAVCFLAKHIDDHSLRYKDFYASRQWEKAENAAFQVRAARVAADGQSTSANLQPSLTFAALSKENTSRIELSNQSANVTAADLYATPRK